MIDFNIPEKLYNKNLTSKGHRISMYVHSVLRYGFLVCVRRLGRVQPLPPPSNQCTDLATRWLIGAKSERADTLRTLRKDCLLWTDPGDGAAVCSGSKTSSAESASANA
jgi:hypothetical protein